MRRDVALLGKELAALTMAYQPFCVGDCGWLVETCLKGFTDQRAGRRMVAAHARVNFLQNFEAFLLRHTLMEYLLLGVFVHESVVYKHIMLASLYKALHLHRVLRDLHSG